MKVAVDVDYDESGGLGRAAGVVFQRWDDARPRQEIVRVHRGVAPYRAGRFFERELPCLLPLIEALRRECTLDTVIVDGYVDLDGGAAGLGRRLFDALGGAVEVVGAAKNPFRGAAAVQVLRGNSVRPLFVSTTGDVERAANAIRSMDGPFRTPTLLRRVDRLARDGAEVG